MTCMDAGWEGPPGEGRSRDEKVLNIESEWKKVSSSFLPVEASVEGCGQRCPNGGAWASSADVQRARSAAV